MVLVRWVDSSQPIPAWQWVEDARAPHILVCQTAGFLVDEDENELRIASSWTLSDGADQVMGLAAIPRACVLEMWTLRKGGAR